jgi:hypothetical protein
MALWKPWLIRRTWRVESRGADHVCRFMEEAQSIVSDTLAAPLAPAPQPVKRSFTR